MIPRKPLAFGQLPAQGEQRLPFAIASAKSLSDAAFKGSNPYATPCLRHDCYPSLPLWPGPRRVGPIFHGGSGRCAAGLWMVRNFRFPSTGNALESLSIKTPTRGRSPCTRLSHFSPFSRFRWLVACRTPHRAALPARQAVPLSPKRSMPTRSPAPSSVALPGLQAAASMSAWANATDRLTAKVSSTQRPSGRPARVAFLHVRKAP